MPENSSVTPADSPAKKPGFLRKWGVRFLKTLGVIAVLLALVHAEEYWRGNRAYDRALADWKAAGFPTAEEFFKDDPVIPSEKNLLDAPYFSQWKQANGKAQKNREARLEKWYQLGTIPLPVGETLANQSPFETNWRRLFAATIKGRPGLQSVPGKSDAQILIEAAETDFPDLNTIGASERARPEVSFGYKCPPLDNMFAAETPSFLAIRDSSFPLVLHAAAKLETGDGTPALIATRTALRLEKALGEGNQHTIVGTMIGCMHTKLVPVRLIFEAIRAGAWSDNELQSLEAPLSDNRPLHAIRQSFIGEALGISSAINSIKPGDKFKLVYWNDEHWAPIKEPLSYLIPSGWLQLNSATELDTMRKLLAEAGLENNRAHLLSIRTPLEALANAKSTPGNCVAKWTFIQLTKNSAICAQTQTKLNCCRIGVALERHRLKTGAFPESLDALTPGLIGKIPFGPVTGDMPVYAKNTDGGYTLTYKGEDCLESDLNAEKITGKDIVWIMPAPKTR